MKLAARDLACRRGGRLVFDRLSFSVARGQGLIVTGRNGAGKSSLLRVVAGLLTPEGGELTVDGGDPELSLGEQCHYIGHQDAQKPSLTVLENLTFWTRFLDGEPNRINDALTATGLEDLAALPAGYLSAGQRRRLSLARLIAIPRPVWLLDEPTTALDVSAQEMLARLMAQHLDGGGLILAAVHGAIGLKHAQELRL